MHRSISRPDPIRSLIGLLTPNFDAPRIGRAWNPRVDDDDDDDDHRRRRPLSRRTRCAYRARHGRDLSTCITSAITSRRPIAPRRLRALRYPLRKARSRRPTSGNVGARGFARKKIPLRARSRAYSSADSFCRTVKRYTFCSRDLFYVSLAARIYYVYIERITGTNARARSRRIGFHARRDSYASCNVYHEELYFAAEIFRTGMRDRARNYISFVSYLARMYDRAYIHIWHISKRVSTSQRDR